MMQTVARSRIIRSRMYGPIPSSSIASVPASMRTNQRFSIRSGTTPKCCESCLFAHHMPLVTTEKRLQHCSPAIHTSYYFCAKDLLFLFSKQFWVSFVYVHEWVENPSISSTVSSHYLTPLFVHLCAASHRITVIAGASSGSKVCNPFYCAQHVKVLDVELIDNMHTVHIIPPAYLSTPPHCLTLFLPILSTSYHILCGNSCMSSRGSMPRP